MSSYLITRLPSHSKAFRAIEFMHKNAYSYRVSSNFVFLEALMSNGGGDSRLATGLLEDGFQLGEEDHQLVEQLAGDSMDPQMKSEVQDEHLQQGMGISQVQVKQEVQDDHLQLGMASQVPVILNSERDLKPEAAFQNVGSNGDLDYRRPVTSVMSIRGETILKGGSTDSGQIGDISPVDSNNSVVVEPSFVRSAPDHVDFDGYSVQEENGMNAEDLMDDLDDLEGVKKGMAKKTREEKKKDEKGHRARGVQKKKIGRPANFVKRLLFACPVKKCRSSYKKFKDLKEHVKIHKNKEKDIFCDVCKKEFPSMDDGMEHIRKREDKECCSCGFKAQIESALLYHHRRHTEEKPYSCGLCKKRFSTKSLAERHERTHSGKKPFACSHCDYRTNLNSSLKVHLRIHTGEKPYSCEKCDAKFTQLSGLKYHMKKNHH